MSGLLELPKQSVFASSAREYPAYTSQNLAAHSSFTDQVERLFETIQSSSATKNIYLGAQVERLFETIQSSSATKNIYLGYKSCKEHLIAERSSWVQDLVNQLRELQNLKQGWNGYDALPPNQLSLSFAKALVDEAIHEGIEPDHMGASISGGVGFTFANDSYDYVVEFLNDGSIVETIISINQVEGNELDVRLITGEDSIAQIMAAIKGLAIV